jgi:hypothetical protein
MAVQFSNWTRNFVFNFGNNGFITLAQIMTPLLQARIACIASVTGATYTASALFVDTFTGATDAFMVWQATNFVTDGDVAIDIMAAMNQSQFATLSGTTGAYAPQINQGILIAAPAGSSGDSTPPLDLDVGINNGANIFSVNSRTFTEP